MVRINMDQSSIKCLYNKNNTPTFQMGCKIFQNSQLEYFKIEIFLLLTELFCSVTFKLSMVLCLWLLASMHPTPSPRKKVHISASEIL